MNQLSILDHFTWARFAFLSGMYTFIVLTSGGFKIGIAFSYRRAAPLPTILRVHLQYLAALLLLYWLMTSLYPHLPYWMIDQWIHARGSKSDLEVLLLLAMLGMFFAERKRIYVKAANEREEAS